MMTWLFGMCKVSQEPVVENDRMGFDLIDLSEVSLWKKLVTSF